LNQRRIRGPTFHFEYEYDSETKDKLEDLLTLYSTPEEILTNAIALLHEQHFGSISKRTPPPVYSRTFSASDDTTSEKLDELWRYVQEIKDQFPKAQAANHKEVDATEQKQLIQFSEEANKRILKKIDELGMRFSKIISTADQTTGQKPVTAEMSNEEVLQLIKRIDKLESKLTKAISQSRISAPVGGTSRRPLRDLGEPPKIGEIKKIEGRPPEPEDRPLLDDVLDTVIVSVESDDE